MPFLEAGQAVGPTVSEGILWAIIAAPLIGWAIIVLYARKLPAIAGWIAAAAVGVAMVLSFVQQNTPLDGNGMPGCWQLLNLDFASSLQVNAGLAVQALPIPNNQSLLGMRLFGQAATFSPGANPLGIATSNGVELHLGY